MLASEKKFMDILDDIFLGVEFEKSDETLFTNHKARQRQGFVNLLRAKSAYFSAFKEKFLQDLKAKVGTNEELKIEIYDKLYDFFHRYFSPTGSVFYHQTPLFYNVFTKSYEKITSKDTELFYKTNMLYYVKSDKIYKELTIKLAKDKLIKFDVNSLDEKKANQKTQIIFEFLTGSKDTLTLQVSHSQKGKKTDKESILKKAHKAGFDLDEEMLKKALNSFNKQSSFDFFINKNAKEFLSRELDLWIYQYLFSQKNSFSPERIKQIEAFKELALKLIDFIAKFEDELVKIWTKPRFALNSHYLVSLSTLKEKGFDLEKIYKHKNFDAQKAHWQELGLKSDNGLFSNETLALDTRFFESLKEEIEMLFDENELNGLLIKAENFGALNTLLPRFKDKIDLIYIDPPYNTGGDDFIYLDKFNHASWLTMMSNRLEFAKEFLKESGSIFISIDDNEQARLKILCDELFGEENFISNIVWLKGNAQNDADTIQRNQEYIVSYAKSIETKPIKAIKQEVSVKVFKDEKMDKFYYEGAGLAMGGGDGGNLEKRPNLGYTFYYNPQTKDIKPLLDYDKNFVTTTINHDELYNDDEKLIKQGYVPIRPPKMGVGNGRWKWALEKTLNELNRILIKKGKNGYSISRKEWLNPKQVRQDDGGELYAMIEKENPPKSFIDFVGSGAGTKELKEIFNDKVFNNPKPEKLLKRIVEIASSSEDGGG
ncbi:site-specific DNA-methyltransferase [Campylobacter sp. VTCC 70190]|uniref:site-specific DNA-methyltransferase n=1 Tax=Campylobacter sp. VTCC 70190 TaxID=3392118 RepID=UPI00398E3AED